MLWRQTHGLSPHHIAQALRTLAIRNGGHRLANQILQTVQGPLHPKLSDKIWPMQAGVLTDGLVAFALGRHGIHQIIRRLIGRA